MAKPSKKSPEEQEDGILNPQSNPLLMGHNGAQLALKDAFHSDRFPHAWLLTGPSGIGKATLGFRFARYVCHQIEEKPLFDAEEDLLHIDPDSSSFHKVAADAHPNLRVIQRSTHPTTGKLRTEITVDEVRKAVQLLRTTSADGGWRIIIVDSVDEMNRNAANALLKTLEEPPANCLFLLINHALGAGLPTIRSRCRILKMGPVDKTDVQAILSELFPDIAPEKLNLVAELSRGRPGWAAAMLADGKMEILEACNKVLAGLPKLDTDAALKLAEFAAKPGNDSAFPLFSNMVEDRISEALKQPDLPRHKANALFTARDEIHSNLRLTGSRNLSKKQVILDTLFQLRSIMPVPS